MGPYPSLFPVRQSKGGLVYNQPISACSDSVAFEVVSPFLSALSALGPNLTHDDTSTKCAAKWGSSRARFTLAPSSTRDKETFEHVIKNTRSVVVGPLEFCGTGRLHFRGGAANVRTKFAGHHKEMKFKYVPILFEVSHLVGHQYLSLL